jgi:predicted lipid-binding transport protein (Tim44 family)
VTVGNGRSPGILTGRPERAPRPTGTAPNVAAVTQPAAHLPPTDRLDVAPTERMVVASLWAAAAPGLPGGLLFGLAGLFLAPIAGAWLGYRQARASRAASQLIRH